MLNRNVANVIEIGHHKSVGDEVNEKSRFFIMGKYVVFPQAHQSLILSMS